MTESWRRDAATGSTVNLMMTSPSPPPRTAAGQGLRRVGIAVAGFAVLLLGVVLLAVPVPGTTVLVIPLGLTILAREFRWAQTVRDGLAAAVKRAWAPVAHTIRTSWTAIRRTSAAAVLISAGRRAMMYK